MSKKSRNAQRQQQQQKQPGAVASSSPLSNTPLSSSPAWLATPEVPARDLDTPEPFSPPVEAVDAPHARKPDAIPVPAPVEDVHSADEDGGTPPMAAIEEVYGAPTIGVRRPSPLALSPEPEEEEEEVGAAEDLPAPVSLPAPASPPAPVSPPLPTSPPRAPPREDPPPPTVVPASAHEEPSPPPRPRHAGRVVSPMQEAEVGHTRSPVLAPEPTMFSSLSEAVRGYVPSGLVPSAIPTPPRVSPGVSFGAFFTGDSAPPPPQQPSQQQQQQYQSYVQPHQQQPYSHSRAGSRGYSPSPRVPCPIESAARRRSAGYYGPSSPVQWGEARVYGRTDEEVSVFRLDEDEPIGVQTGVGAGAVGGGAYAGEMGESEDVRWAVWDALEEGGPRPRRLLLIGYEFGLQVWDCTDLGSIKEVLNLSSGIGCVTCARVVPAPRTREDAFTSERPLIGLIADNDTGPTFMLYSLSSHRIIKSLDVNNPVTFSVNHQFLIISTFSSSALHVISTDTFDTLYTVPASAIVPYISNTPEKASVLSTHPLDAPHAPPPRPEPVFALSGRLLAFAAHPPASPASAHGGPQAILSTHSQGALSIAAAATGNITQADIGAAALKVGGTVLSGMRAIGGFALSAARSRISGELPVPQHQHQLPQSPRVGQFASKSAPAASGYASPVIPIAHRAGTPTPGRQASMSHSPTQNAAFGMHQQPVETPTLTSGVYVRVLDLGSLPKEKEGGGRTVSPRTVAEFQVSREPVARVAFTSDGTSLIVAHKDGHVSKLYRLRPAGAASLHARRARAAKAGEGREDGQRTEEKEALETPAHVYDLRRGRTVGVIERVVGDRDGRWVALGTRNRTVHVYAVNPYGGKPDERSHLEGRVRNVSEMPPLSTDLSPIVRLHGSRPSGSHIHTPLAFTFVDPDASLPNALLPPPSTALATPQSPSRSLPGSPAQVPLSSPGHAPRTKRTRNYQDVLIFDPADGTLSIRRITLEARAAREPGTLSIPLATSISLPTTGALTRMANSPPSAAATKPSGLTQMMDRPAELVAKEGVVATWHLKRGRGWKEIKHVLVKKAGGQVQLKGTDWIAQAELSTFSRSPRVIPRTIYLVRRFSFYAFGEDYHALIRRFQLDVPTTKINVRKQVEINPYPSAEGESFVHSGTAPRDIRGGSGGRAPSSFEGPLSSALSGGLDYAQTGTPILPMLPNGTPSSYAGIGGAARPIRNLAAGIGEGVSEGLGRLRRSVRPPRTGATAAAAAADPALALEFDEADEDFSPTAGESRPKVVSREPIRPSVSQETTTEPELELHRPVTPLADDVAPLVDVVGEEGWSAWSADDGQAVMEQERFDDLVVGFMDEEQTQAQTQSALPPAPLKNVGADAKRKKKGKK